MSVCARRRGGGWPANRFCRNRRSGDGDLSCGGGHFTQAAEVGKNPRIPLIAVGLAHLQGSFAEPLEESGFLTALPGWEGEYQPRPQESHGCRMGKSINSPMLKNPECCHQTRPVSPETLRPGRPSLASQSSRIKPFKPEPNERIGLYSFLLRARRNNGQPA